MSKFFYFNKLKPKKSFRIAASILTLFIILCCGIFYEAYKYNYLINNFKSSFNEFKFSEANNLLLTKEKLNLFKEFRLENDLTKYFDNKINTLSDELKAGLISHEYALIELKEIDRYNTNSNNITSFIDSIDSMNDSANNYDIGVSYFDSEEYDKAISALNSVSMLDLNYTNSLKYLNESKNKIKEILLSHCDDLVKDDYYTQALSEIHNSNDILQNDDDINNKILEIKSLQQKYLDENSSIAEASSQALITIISPDNINTLNVKSDTSYLINVNIKSQKTYIYNGKCDNWILVKSFPCSTGIAGEDTPSGSFSIKEKGDWFFSEKYNQGGKYWTQVTGDILFHSLPFDRDKTTVVDYTMNKPSSHGCIRLSIDDAKWIYTNIPKDSKVIIK